MGKCLNGGVSLFNILGDSPCVMIGATKNCMRYISLV